LKKNFNKIKNSGLHDAITIDPGLNTGWVIWKNNRRAMQGIIKEKEISNDRVETIFKITEYLDNIISINNVKSLYVEGVSLWENSLKSITSANTGKTFWLAYLVGAITQLAKIKGCEVTILLPNEWKGQLSKEVVRRRIALVEKQDYKRTPDHIEDALAMGYSIMGIL
jgi:hypothetical protein